MLCATLTIPSSTNHKISLIGYYYAAHVHYTAEPREATATLLIEKTILRVSQDWEVEPLDRVPQYSSDRATLTRVACPRIADGKGGSLLRGRGRFRPRDIVGRPGYYVSTI